MKSSSHQEQYNIAKETICDIADQYQGKRQFNIIRIKDFIEFSVNITNIHINNGIKPDDISKKNVGKQSAEKPEQEPCLLASHKSEGSRQDDHKIRNDTAKCNCLKYRAL